jgi:hypothetical protein
MMHSSNRAGLAVVASLALVAGIALFRGVGASESPRGADIAVSCGPTQRAVVRQSVTDNGPKVDIDCVDGPATTAASYVIDADGQVVPAPLSGGYVSGAAAVVPARYEPQIVRAPVIDDTVAPAPRRVVSSAPSERVRKGTSWQKRALVIGGSAGAGAGVGALIGGKKGALIGAALGGGGAALVDALKRD